MSIELSTTSEDLHFTAQRSRRSWNSPVILAGAAATRYLRRHNAKEHVMHTYIHEFRTTHASQSKLHTFVNVRVSARNIDVV